MRIDTVRINKTHQYDIDNGVPPIEANMSGVTDDGTGVVAGRFGYYQTVDEVIEIAENMDWSFCITFSPDFPIKEGLLVLWEKLSDIPVDEEEEIELPFNGFEAGTSIWDVWDWFEAANPDFKVINALYHKDKYD